MATIINAELMNGIYYVTYESGTIRKYDESKLPKTVSSWVEANTSATSAEECPLKIARVPQNEVKNDLAINSMPELQKAHTGQNMKPDGMWASEAVMFGLLVSMAVAWFVTREIIEILAIILKNTITHIWNNRSVCIEFAKKIYHSMPKVPSLHVSNSTIPVIVRLVPVLIGLAVLI